ncbi:MAG: citrate (Si)-synthase [Burkholderiales bacterium]|jgi:citrate synthase|nr:citrate (Si)-synthase [Burkholderiales bacterium]
MGTVGMTWNDQTWGFPLVEGSEGEVGLDLTRLRERTGLVALDPALVNTAPCTSSITFLDGERGILHYRGIPIEEFASVERPDFVEVAWHLIFGRLPRRDELEAFQTCLEENASLPEGFLHLLEGFPVDATPMAMLSATFASLACFRQQGLDPHAGHPESAPGSHARWRIQGQSFEAEACRLLSRGRTLAAWVHRKCLGLGFIPPEPGLRYAAGLLHMLFARPPEGFQVDPVLEDALNLLLIVHADHAQSCSTTAVRVVGSSLADLETSCAAGISALGGTRHGRTNVAVLEMLEDLLREGRSARECLELVRRKGSGLRLMGFGHRIYKNLDPRARLLKACAQRVADHLQVPDPFLDLAREIEEMALEDPYFIERRLYPNVDFYSGIIMRSLGIPTGMFPVLFAIARLPGWIAHWRELQEEPGMRIVRPRQIYTGPIRTHYVPLSQR